MLVVGSHEWVVLPINMDLAPASSLLATLSSQASDRRRGHAGTRIHEATRRKEKVPKHTGVTHEASLVTYPDSLAVALSAACDAPLSVDAPALLRETQTPLPKNIRVA